MSRSILTISSEGSQIDEEPVPTCGSLAVRLEVETLPSPDVSFEVEQKPEEPSAVLPSVEATSEATSVTSIPVAPNTNTDAEISVASEPEVAKPVAGTPSIFCCVTFHTY